MERDPATGEQLLARSLAGLTLEDSGGFPVDARAADSEVPASLDDVRRIVRDALAQ